MVTMSASERPPASVVPTAASTIAPRPLLLTSARAFAIMVAGAVFGLAAQLGTVRLIGAEGFGIYAYVLAWTTLLGYVSTLGFHVSLLKLLPALRVREEWAQARALLRLALGGGAVAGVVVALAAAAVFAVLHSADTGAGTGNDTRRALIIGAAVVPLMAVRLIGAAAVRAFGGIVTAMVSERILRDLFALLILATLVLGGFAPASAVTAVVSMLGAAVIVLAVVMWFLAASRPAEFVTAPTGRADPHWVREWLRPVPPLTAIMFADTLLSRSGILVIGMFGNPAEAGVFALAFSLALTAAMPRMAVAVLFAPTVSTLYTRGDHAGLQILHRRSTIMTLAGTVAVGVPLVAGAPILLAWFGEDFSAAQPVLVVLLLGQLAAATGGPQQHLLTMTGHERQGAALMAAASMATLGLGALFYVVFGIVGVAAAFATCMAAWNVGMAVFLSRRLGIRPALSPFAGRRSEAGP